MKWPNWIVNTFTDNRPPEKRAANLPDINAKLDRIIELLEKDEQANRRRERSVYTDPNLKA